MLEEESGNRRERSGNKMLRTIREHYFSRSNVPNLEVVECNGIN